MPFRGHRSRRKTNKLPRARENAGDQLRIGFYLCWFERVVRRLWTNHKAK